MTLTGKKKVFADAVLAGKSNRDAALAAGYAAPSAAQAGSRLVKDPAVADYLAKARAKKKPGRPPAEKPAATGPDAADAGPTFDLAAAMQHTDPKAFLTAAMNDMALEPKQRIIAAKALLPLFHGKVPDQGKKDGKEEAAKKAAGGRFASSAPPLKLVGKK